MTGWRKIDAGHIQVRSAGALACMAVSAVLLVVALSGAAHARINYSRTSRCENATGPKIVRIPGAKNSCGGPALNWCTPPGMASVGARECGPPGPELYAAWASYNAKHGRGKVATRAAPERPARSAPARAAAPAPAPSPPQKSADCSTISGLGGSGPSDCAPATGVPANVQAQIDQGKSSMQAAKTVRDSDPSYNGWAAAAAQYRKAEAAFRAAGDMAQALAAAEQAQTLESALKIADQKSGQGAPASASPQAAPSAAAGPAANSCPPAAPAGPWQGANAAYCASANCVDRGSAYYGMLCFPPDQQPANGKAQSGPAQPQAPARQQAAGPLPDVNALRAQQGSCSDITGLGGGSSGPSNCAPTTGQRAPQEPTLPNGGQSQRANQTKPLSPSAVTPNFQNAILSLADTVIDMPDGGSLRERLLRRMQRTLADHRVPMTPKDYACLQPAAATDRAGAKLVDVPLRWRPEHIKTEAIDRSHVCDDVAAGDAKEVCREEKYGQAVMWAEPELAGLCRAEGGPDHDIDKVAECAKRKFLNAWARRDGIVQDQPPTGWSPPADCTAAAAPETRKRGFRSRLREKLAAALAASGSATGSEGADAGAGGEDVAAGGAEQTAALPPPPEAAAPRSDDNEAYCSYMAREVVRGELTPGGGAPIPATCKATVAAAEALRKRQQASGAPPFSMSDVETDQEIGRLTREPGAQTP